MGEQIRGAIRGGAMAVGNAVGVVLSGIARAGAIAGDMSAVGGAASGIAQAGSSTVVNGMNTVGAVSRSSLLVLQPSKHQSIQALTT